MWHKNCIENWEFKFYGLDVQTMNNRPRLLALVALTLGLSVFSQSVLARNVLVIWGADADQPWTAAVFEALNSALKNSQEQINLFSESLSYNRLRALPNPTIWATHINQKYADAQIDLVISFEHTAARQLDAASSDLLPLADKFAILGNGKLKQIATAGEDTTLARHIRDVKTLLPNIQQHLVISSLPLIRQEAAELARQDSHIQLLTENASYLEMFEQIEALPRNSAITYAVMHRDGVGEARNPRVVLEEILQRAKVPVFVNHSTLLIPGVVGGHTLDAYKVAKLMLESMLRAEPTSASLDLGSLSLDVTELNRWNIPLARVPAEALLFNEPLSFWQDHRSQVSWIAGLLAVALIGIGLLTLLLRQRNRNLRISELHREASEQLQQVTQARLVAEQQKLEAVQFATLAMNSAEIGTYRYDPTSDRIWLSTIAQTILGLKPDDQGIIDSATKALAARIHPDDMRRMRSDYPQNTQDQQTLIYRVLNDEGEERWIQSVSDFNPESTAFSRVGVIRDITQERQLTERLVRAQERMDLALEAANIELFEIETESGIALPLSSGRGVFQLGQRFSFVDGISNQALSPSTREALRSVIRQENRTFEFTEHNLDGDKHRWVQVVTGRFYQRDGKQYLTLVYTDISNLRQQEYATRKQSIENELALSALGAGVARIHPRTGRTYLSQRAQEIWDTGPLVNDETSLMILAEQHHPEDDTQVRAKFREMMTGKRVEGQEYRIRLRSGKYRWIQAFGQTHYDISGNPEVIAVFYDIDEEKRQLELVEGARERQSRLFAIIGHELRTPVATLQMMLAEQGIYQLEPFGKQIRDTMQHTLSVLDDLRSVTQPQLRVNQESSVSPYEQLEQTLSSLTGLLEAHNIRPHFLSNPDAQTRCQLDHQSLRQMITNLIKNAAIHSGATDIWLTLEAESESDERINLRISLSDNGKGIPESEIETLFEPFRRGDTQADGTGLGLHICRDLAQRMGGTLTYERSAQGGAKFNFNANFKIAEDVETPDAPEPQKPSQLLNGMRVLYAEDQKTLQMLTTALLKKQGAHVVVANDGAEALALFETQDFDFVLTDIMMPNLDGYGLTQALRETGYRNKIIGLTAATIGLETDQLLAAGADATLSKPVDINKLVGLVTATADSL